MVCMPETLRASRILAHKPIWQWPRFGADVLNDLLKSSIVDAAGSAARAGAKKVWGWWRPDRRRIIIKFNAPRGWLNRNLEAVKAQLIQELSEYLKLDVPDRDTIVIEGRAATVNRSGLIYISESLEKYTSTVESVLQDAVYTTTDQFRLEPGEMKVNLLPGSVKCVLDAPEWALISLLGAIAVREPKLVEIFQHVDLELNTETSVELEDWPVASNEAGPGGPVAEVAEPAEVHTQSVAATPDAQPEGAADDRPVGKRPCEVWTTSRRRQQRQRQRRSSSQRYTACSGRVTLCLHDSFPVSKPKPNRCAPL